MLKIPLYFPPINKLGNIAFRELCFDNEVDYVFTEMIRIEKLLELDQNQLNKLKVAEKSKNKTFVQIITKDLNLIEKGIDKIVDLFPEVKEINYNMGCPQSSLCKDECGAGIVANPILVEEVSKIFYNSCKKYNIQASIKIRLGITRDNITIYENVKRIKKIGIKKIYIHGRVLKDTYSRPATYLEIGKVKKENPELEIIANGDIIDLISLNNIINETNCDGVLIGRAALENPEIFKILKENYSKNKIDNFYFENQKSGVLIKDRIKLIKNYLIIAKKYDIDISAVKANLSYMTKSTIGGAKFRKEVNSLTEIDILITLCDNYN